MVSFGHWNEWTQTVLPYIQGRNVLEIGHGPGHLQRLLLNQGLVAAGLDESAQMGRLASARIRGARLPVRLTRGLAQTLPFPAAMFDCLVSTFPAEYIFDERTLTEAHRVLKDGGRFVVLPAGWPTNRFLSWLFRFTGESPAEAREIIKEKWSQPFIRAGFTVDARTLEVQSGVLLLIIAEKPSEGS